MDAYHTQRLEDFQKLAKEHLNREIAPYEQVCPRLNSIHNLQSDRTLWIFRRPCTARQVFDQIDSRTCDNHRSTSMSPNPRLNPARPSPIHTCSTPGSCDRLVSPSKRAPGRASIFSKFWCRRSSVVLQVTFQSYSGLLRGAGTGRSRQDIPGSNLHCTTRSKCRAASHLLQLTSNCFAERRQYRGRRTVPHPLVPLSVHVCVSWMEATTVAHRDTARHGTTPYGVGW